MTIGALIPDMSHYQADGVPAPPDWGAIEAQVAAGSVAGIIFKATENMGVDPWFERFRQAAEDRKIRWLAYPFLRPGDTQATIEHFVKEVGKDAIPALDWEAAGVSSDIVEGWQDICDAELRSGLCYYGFWPPALATPRIGKWLRWYAQYPNNPNAAPRLPAWDGMTVTDWRKEWFLWQYTGSGHLGGISAQVDLSRLSCPIEVFNHWYDTGELQTWNIAPTTGETAPAVPALSSVRKSLPITIGASGDDVAQVQRALTAAGFSLNDDGHFGPATRAAVMAFQKAKGLQVDGIVGAQTLAALTP